MSDGPAVLWEAGILYPISQAGWVIAVDTVCGTDNVLIGSRFMKCPHDGSQLQAVDVRGIEIDKCHQCDGLWLDHGELKSLRELDLGDIEEELEDKYGNPAVESGEISGYMRCPRCGEKGRLMRHHVSYFHAPVQVDRCQQCHGMWLDDQELNSLMADKRHMDRNLSSNRFIGICKALARRFSNPGGG